jgi:hypothetical protein
MCGGVFVPMAAIVGQRVHILVGVDGKRHAEVTA